MPVEKGFLAFEIPRHARVYLLLLRARPVVPIPVVLQGFTVGIMDMPRSSIASLRCLLSQLQAFLIGRDELFGLLPGVRQLRAAAGAAQSVPDNSAIASPSS